MKRLECVISGMVQGVGFRYYARQWAQRLGLAGFVRNLPDGRVEVAAEGPEAALQQFLGALKKGPPGSRVSDCDVRWETPQGRSTAFEVRF